MWIAKEICLFLLYSFLGWIYETLYCTVKNGRWENRGFLYGPVCPIYGVGAVLITFFADRFPAELRAGRLAVFLIAFFGSMVLEYVTSWTLEVLFHAVWWDYSDLPLNIQGRTSVPTSLGFGAAGILVVDLIAPATRSVVAALPPIAAEGTALLLTAVVSVDCTLTVSALTNFARIVKRMDDSFNERMEALVENAEKRRAAVHRRVALESMGRARRHALQRVRAFRYGEDNGKVDLFSDPDPDFLCKREKTGQSKGKTL